MNLRVCVLALFVPHLVAALSAQKPHSKLTKEALTSYACPDCHKEKTAHDKKLARVSQEESAREIAKLEQQAAKYESKHGSKEKTEQWPGFGAPQSWGPSASMKDAIQGALENALPGNAPGLGWQPQAKESHEVPVQNAVVEDTKVTKRQEEEKRREEERLVKERIAQEQADADPAEVVVDERTDEEKQAAAAALAEQKNLEKKGQSEEKKIRQAAYAKIDGIAHEGLITADPPVVDLEPSVSKRKVSARVAVINLDSRRDRCKCAGIQLDKSPFPVERYSATRITSKLGKFQEYQFKFIDKHDKGAASQQCEGLFTKGINCAEDPHHEHDCVGDMSFLCSEYRLWQQMYEQHKEDYFIIMKDDVLLAENFGEKLQTFLETYPEDFDVLQLDSYGGDAMPYEDLKHRFQGTLIYRPSESGDYHGAHGLVLKRAAVPELLESLKTIGGVSVDKLPKVLTDMTKLKVLEAKLKVFTHPEDAKKRGELLEAAGCASSVVLTERELKLNEKSKVDTSGKKLKSPEVFKCPASS